MIFQKYFKSLSLSVDLEASNFTYLLKGAIKSSPVAMGALSLIIFTLRVS